MSFGNSVVFPFPAVQYIPLPLTKVRQQQLRSAHHKTELPQLIVGEELTLWKEILINDYQIELPPSFVPDSLPLLCLNIEIQDVKYRGNFITMIGKQTPGYYQLSTIPRRYFYKKNLFFELYDQVTSKRIIRKSMVV